MLDKSKNWLEGDLQSLIANKIPENLSLEYKSSDALNLLEERHKKEFTKDVSAFANSEGGILIYGIVEENHLPNLLDAGIDPNIITKERIEQILHSGIKPKISRLHINPVQLSNSRNIAYVITIPQSDTAHQASDHRYYRRYNFLSAPMEDYEIRDVMNRVKCPKIIPNFKSTRSTESTSNQYIYSLVVTLKNEGAIRAHQIKFEIIFPSKLIIQNATIFTLNDLEKSRKIPFDAKILTLIKKEIPIFPQDEVKHAVLSFGVDEKLHEFITTNSPVLIWNLYADDAPPSRGEILIESLIDY